MLLPTDLNHHIISKYRTLHPVNSAYHLCTTLCMFATRPPFKCFYTLKHAWLRSKKSLWSSAF